MYLANSHHHANNPMTNHPIDSYANGKDDLHTITTKTPASIPTPNAPNLADFQRQFGQYLRQQNRNDIDWNEHNDNDTHTNNSTTAILQRISQDIPNRIGTLYQSLTFNNVCSFLDQCFPVCRSLITDGHWLKICQAFFLQHPCHSPYFTEINQSFVDFLAQPEQLKQLDLPAYFAELAHYEWVELMVDTHTNAGIALADETAQITINPSLQNLHYQWPVHLISSEEQPDSPEDSFFFGIS